jgi:hypothetical protein
VADGSDIGEQWRLPSLVDYYDFNQDCLSRNSIRLAALSETDQATALSVVERSVTACLTNVNDETLAKWAISLADDLYKSGNFEGPWGPPQWAYVRAVWGTFFSVLGGRGLTLRYVIENAFPDPLQRPLWLYPNLFQSAGIVYICPHALARELPEGKQVEPSLANLRPLVAEGRVIAGSLAEKCTELDKHFVYLELDFDEGCLSAVSSLTAGPGTIKMFRNTAPIAGSTILADIVAKS